MEWVAARGGLECAHSPAVAYHVVVVAALAIAAAVVSLAVTPVHPSRTVPVALLITPAASILLILIARSPTLVLVMMVGQARVLIAADQPLVHLEVARAFPLQAGERHQLPLLDEEIAAVLARHAYFLQLVAHKLPLRVTYALRKGALNVNGEALWTLNSCFHGCCSCRIVPQ